MTEIRESSGEKKTNLEIREIWNGEIGRSEKVDNADDLIRGRNLRASVKSSTREREMKKKTAGFRESCIRKDKKENVQKPLFRTEGFLKQIIIFFNFISQLTYVLSS